MPLTGRNPEDLGGAGRDRGSSRLVLGDGGVPGVGKCAGLSCSREMSLGSYNEIIRFISPMLRRT